MSFIEKHGLWTEAQKHRAAEIKDRLKQGDIKLVRLAWADPHGYSRAKMVAASVLVGALTNGYNINVATSTLDSANARTFSSFTRGGGMGLDEMTGSPNLTIVPDPMSFRVLPWAPGVAWIICDEYFNSGVPFHFSPRQLLKKQIRKLEADELNEQITDLERSVAELRKLVRELGLEIRNRFEATYATVEAGFAEVDVQPHAFAVEWMENFESFQAALDEANLHSDSYINSLTRSLSLALDEFYSSLSHVGVSSVTGEGFPALLAAVQPATASALYFVARGDGSSQFSNSLEEHNRAVNRFIRGRPASPAGP